MELRQTRARTAKISLTFSARAGWQQRHCAGGTAPRHASACIAGGSDTIEHKRLAGALATPTCEAPFVLHAHARSFERPHKTFGDVIGSELETALKQARKQSSMRAPEFGTNLRRVAGEDDRSAA
eukprot:1218842-Pleurochrysis_carterae.AAC.1